MRGKGFDHGNVSLLILAEGDFYRTIELGESVSRERGKKEEESGLLGASGVALKTFVEVKKAYLLAIAVSLSKK